MIKYTLNSTLIEYLMTRNGAENKRIIDKIEIDWDLNDTKATNLVNGYYNTNLKIDIAEAGIISFLTGKISKPVVGSIVTGILYYKDYKDGKNPQLDQKEKYYQAVTILKQERQNKADQMYKADNMILYGAPYNIYGSDGKIIMKNLNEFNKDKTTKLTVEMAEKMRIRNENYRRTRNPNLFLNHRRLSVRELK